MPGVYILSAISYRESNFWLSIPFSYLAVIYIISGIGYLEFYIGSMGSNVFTLYGQLSLIFVSGAIFFVLISLITLYLGLLKATGYSFGLGILFYGFGRTLFILNNGETLSLSAKSPLVFLVLVVVTSLLFMLATHKMYESSSTIIALIATLFFLASWLYNGYMNYTHFDPNDTYGIIRGSLIEALKASFMEPIYVYLGGPFFPLVAMGALISLVAFRRGSSFEESLFLRVVGLATVLIALLGVAIGFYPAVYYLTSTLDTLTYFDNIYVGGLTIGLLILLFASLISVFNLFGAGVTYELEEVEEFREREEKRKIGIVAREREKEELESIEDIDLEDLDLEL